MKHIAILDFGSQYTHLISRNVREFNVLSKIYHHDVSAQEIKGKVWGIIISGGPQATYDENSIKVDPEIFNLNVPILGICYGHQLIAHMLGGEVRPGEMREYGRAKIKIEKDAKIFQGIDNGNQVWMSHGDTVMKTPNGFTTIASTDDCSITAMANEEKNIYGLQFHPEVVHTENGAAMLKNFVLGICQATPDWKMDDIITDLEGKIRNQVGEKKVFVLCSGGVDSSVAFALLTRALGKERVVGLYIDTGFMRSGESEEIMENFRQVGFDNIKNIDASDEFFGRLVKIYDPEEKRKIIGQTFLDVKDNIAKELNLNSEEWLLGQGTIYPDTIESGATKNADKIKTHHNRVDAIQKMIERGLVVEPLVDFYKDEVREIGKLIGLPKALLARHPFPGPGLAIRALCFDKEKEENNLEKVKEEIEKIYGEEFDYIKKKLLPIKSVGVQGDNRTYAHPLAVWGENDWEKLHRLSVRTTNSIRGINRVILLLNNKENNDFQLLQSSTYLTRERIKILREMDGIVNEIVQKAGIYDNIWQFPVVLIPLTDGSKKESIVLRPINSRDAMTLNFYRMEKEIIDEIVEKISSTGKISHIFYDITDKPPGTTEWE